MSRSTVVQGEPQIRNTLQFIDFYLNYQFYCQEDIMMARYQIKPEIKGRNMPSGNEDRGRKHFWGEKGKNYGFYTTPEEIEMEQRRKMHRQRMKSELNEYEQNTDWLNPQDRRYRSILRSHPDMANYKNTLTPTAVYQKQEIAIQTEQSNIAEYQRGTDIKEKLKEYLQKTKKHQEMHLNSRIMEVKLPQLVKKNESLKITTRRQTEPVLKQSQIYRKQWQREHSQQNLRDRKEEVPIVYIANRCRKYNPTFCNSFGYPLHCYRYVA